MNLFFGPAGRLFDSETAQLNRNREIAQRQVAQLRTLPLDAVLQTLANVYVLGVTDGVMSLPDYCTVQATHVKHQLIASLSTTDSVEFLTMDETISGLLKKRNGVKDVYDLDDADEIELEKEDLFRAYVAGWVLGNQNVSYQAKKNELGTFDDAWLYRTCNKTAWRNAEARHYTDYREQTVQTTYGEQLLNCLNETLSELD